MTTTISNNSFNSSLPNVYVQRVELSRKLSESLEINLQILLKSPQDDWYKPNSTGTSIRLMMCFITDKNEIRKIYKYPSYLRGMIKQDNLMSGVYKKYIDIGNINSFSRTASREIINIEKGLYTENLSYNIKAVINDIPYPYLSCLIVPYFASSQAFSRSGLDATGIFPTGNLCVEDILIGNNVPRIGKIFTLKESHEGYGSKGDVWAGPVHTSPSGKYMAGQTHGPVSHPTLTSATYTNKKVLDFRYRTEGLDAWKSLNRQVRVFLKEKERKKNISYFSPMAYSRKRQDSVNLFFGIDMVSIARQLTKYSHLYTSSADLLSAIRVLDVVLYRKRVTRAPLGNRLTGVTPNDFDKNYIETPVCSLSEQTLQSVNISNVPSNMYHFTGNDQGMVNINDGLYQYKVKVRIADLTHQKISNTVEALSVALADYERYISLAQNPAAFDNTMNAFKEKYIKILYNSGSAWSNLVNLYVAVANGFLGTAVSDQLDLGIVRKNMLNMTDPRSATVSSLLRARKIVQDLLSQLSAEVSSMPATLGSSELQKYGSTISTSRPKGALIEKEHYFLSAYSARDRRNIGLEYFKEIPERGSQILRMSTQQWRERMGYEASYYSGENAVGVGIRTNGYISPQSIKTPVGDIKVQKEMQFDTSLPLLMAKTDASGRLNFDRAYSPGVDGQSMKRALLGRKGITVKILYQGVSDFMQKNRNSSSIVKATDILGKGSKFDIVDEDCEDTEEIKHKGATDKDAEIKDSPMVGAVLGGIAENFISTIIESTEEISNSYATLELSTKTDTKDSNIFQFGMNHNSARVVEYLAGYKGGPGSAAGPIWIPLTDGAVDKVEASKKAIVCRMRTLNSITNGENIYKLDAYNETFIIGNPSYSNFLKRTAGLDQRNNLSPVPFPVTRANEYPADLPIEYLNSYSVSLNRAAPRTSGGPPMRPGGAPPAPTRLGATAGSPAPTPRRGSGGGSSGMGGY